jgi:hypothetical protein
MATERLAMRVYELSEVCTWRLAVCEVTTWRLAIWEVITWRLFILEVITWGTCHLGSDIIEMSWSEQLLWHFESDIRGITKLIT